MKEAESADSDRERSAASTVGEQFAALLCELARTKQYIIQHQVAAFCAVIGVSPDTPQSSLVVLAPGQIVVDEDEWNALTDGAPL